MNYKINKTISFNLFTHTKKLLVLVSLMAIANTAFAEPRTEYLEITNIRTLASGGVLVSVGSNVALQNSAVICSSGAFLIANDAEGKDELIGTLFLAFGQNRPIQIEVPTVTNRTTCPFGTRVNSLLVR